MDLFKETIIDSIVASFIYDLMKKLTENFTETSKEQLIIIILILLLF